MGKFSEFTNWVDQAVTVGGLLEGRPQVAMYCTGGIRCEKAANLLLEKYDFQSVLQLKGGIQSYLRYKAERVARDCDVTTNHWHGDCFVFDDRTVVTAANLPATDEEALRLATRLGQRAGISLRRRRKAVQDAEQLITIQSGN